MISHSTCVGAQDRTGFCLSKTAAYPSAWSKKCSWVDTAGVLQAAAFPNVWRSPSGHFPKCLRLVVALWKVRKTVIFSGVLSGSAEVVPSWNGCLCICWSESLWKEECDDFLSSQVGHSPILEETSACCTDVFFHQKYIGTDAFFVSFPAVSAQQL